MAKVAPKAASIDQRKFDHIKINLEQDVRSALTTGLENYHFIHEALPELDLARIDPGLSLFGKKLAAPILISSMTGGTEEAGEINQRLAEAAQEVGVAMGVGSQRAALEHPEQTPTFAITRQVAPDILLFANLGAVQLNYGYTIEHCRRAVDMIDADALILHLNPLQEAVQDAGDTNFADLARKIEVICKKLEVPVIAKEVGWGMSERSAKLLADCGVSAIDVAGAGGTSWSQVEMHRAPDEFTRKLAATFVGWGIPTAESILNVKRTLLEMTVFASGGIKDGLDIAKCVALGASLGGMAGKFLKAAAVSTEQVVEMMKLTKKQIEVSMFACGAGEIRDLGIGKLYEKKQVSSLTAQTLNKAVEYEVSQSQTQLAEIEKVLAEYENQFNISTAEFIKRYQAGQTDDSAESVEWASLAQMAESIRKRLAMLSEPSE